jgi:GPH family glycoside/pentoside/hexuronide:cation symporter
MARISVQSTDLTRKKVPFWVKVGYGGFEGSYSLIWTIFYVFFMFYATDVVGLSPSSAGIIMMISGFGDAISDIFTGIITDKINTRWGRRRPLLLGVALPYAFATWLLFTAPGWGETTTVVYYAIMVIVFYTVIDFVWTPGLALGADMVLDYDERTSLGSFRTAWDIMSSIIAGSTCLLVASYFSERFGSKTAGWSAMAAVYGFAAMFPILLTWRATRGYERYRAESPGISWRAISQAVTQNRSFLSTLGVYTFAGASVNFLIAIGMYWFTYYFRYTEAQISIIMGMNAVGPVIWIPVVNWLGKKLDKKKAILIIYSLIALVYASFWFIKPLGGNTEMVSIIILYLLMGCFGPALWVLAAGMVADAVEVNEFKTGERREGIYFSLASFAQKIAIAFALWGGGFILERAGYVAGGEQSVTALTAIRTLVSWAPAGLMVVSLICAFFNPMTREKHAALVKAIELKKAGKEYDLAQFKDLI